MNSLLILLLLFLGIILSIKKFNFRVGVDGMLFFSLSYLIYAGLRDITFGEDSVNYFNNYFLKSHQYGSILEFISSVDVFFRFINHLLLHFSSNWYFYSFTMACICLYLVIKIDSFSERKVFFFTALIVTNPVFIENTTNILRSTLCCLILIVGYLSYQKKKKGIVTIILGSLTHYLQSIILFLIFLSLKFGDLIKNNRQKNIFAILLFIILIFKTFSSILNFEYFSEFLETVNILLSKNEIRSYTLSQVINVKVNIAVNIFFQLLLYIIVPLFLIKFDTLKSYQKKFFNLVAVSLIAYAILFPQLTFALRLIPFCVLGITYVFTIKMNNYKKIYTLLILFFNSVLIFYNSSNA